MSKTDAGDAERAVVRDVAAPSASMDVTVQRKKSGSYNRAPTATDAEIGQRVRLLRRMSNWTQSRLAQRIGVTNAQMHRYETGATRITTTRLIAIAEALSVQIDELLGHDRPPPPTSEHEEQSARLIRAFGAIRDARHRDMLLSLACSMEARDRSDERRDGST